MKKLIAILALLPAIAFGTAEAEKAAAESRFHHEPGIPFAFDIPGMQYTNSFNKLKIRMYTLGYRLCVEKLNRIPSKGDNLLTAAALHTIEENRSRIHAEENCSSIQAVTIRGKNKKYKTIRSADEIQKVLAIIEKDIIQNK